MHLLLFQHGHWSAVLGLSICAFAMAAKSDSAMNAPPKQTVSSRVASIANFSSRGVRYMLSLESVHGLRSPGPQHIAASRLLSRKPLPSCHIIAFKCDV